SDCPPISKSLRGDKPQGSDSSYPCLRNRREFSQQDLAQSAASFSQGYTSDRSRCRACRKPPLDRSCLSGDPKSGEGSHPCRPAHTRRPKPRSAARNVHYFLKRLRGGSFPASS